MASAPREEDMVHGPARLLPTSSALPSRSESSARSASAARINRAAPPWLLLQTTGGLDEDVARGQRMREIQSGLPLLDDGAGIPQQRDPGELRDSALKPLNDWLSERSARVAATRAELRVAEDRAEAVVAALETIYPAAKTYPTGSIAHGDAMSPLNDVDLGVVLTDRTDLGASPGQSSPHDEMRKAAARLQELLKPQFPHLTANPDNKRSIVLEFNEPAVAGGADFSCDVIIAIPGTGGNLLIPNTAVAAGWDENDPIGHLNRLEQAELASEWSFSRTVRLVKDWRNGQDAKPLYSWNIKTLALEAGTAPTQPFEGLYQFFAHAIHSVAEGPTENPGSANFPPPTVPIDRSEVTRQLIEALRTLDRARMYALANLPEEALAELRSLFPADGRAS